MTERQSITLDATGSQWHLPPWPVALELAQLLPEHSWTLVGGLMVALHSKIAELPLPRITTDVDTALHLETGAISFNETAQLLRGAGFVLDEDTHYAYKFERQSSQSLQPDKVDVLCSDRFAAQHQPKYLGRPLFGVSGATRALKETINVELTRESDTINLVIPSVRGALVLKGAAYLDDSRDRGRHAEDAVILLACLTNPVSALEGFSKESRKRVKVLVNVLSESSIPWANQDPLVQSLAREALEVFQSEF